MTLASAARTMNGGELLAALGTRDQARARCPACGRGERDDTLGVTRTERGIVAHCFRCEYVATERVERAATPRPQPPAPQHHDTLAPRWRAYWRECVPLAGTLGEVYLLRRGCLLPPADGDLRFHARAWHWPTRTERPALVALLTDVVTGEPRSLHWTFLRADGAGKANVDAPRLLLPKHRKAGTVCRLWPDDSVTLGLCVAEGIETALSAAHAFVSIWACVDAGNLAGLPVLGGIEALTIAADHDAAGIRAAERCAQRWAEAGREVRVVRPARAGSDINDMVLS